jgi:hypothetical protein
VSVRFESARIWSGGSAQARRLAALDLTAAIVGSAGSAAGAGGRAVVRAPSAVA